MKLSDGVEWGIHCCVLLAALPPDATINGAALAEFHGVSQSYLLKHLKALAEAGALESAPGPTGGYRLARPPTDLTLLDIVEAIEGTEPALRCTEIRQRGPAALDASAYRRPCRVNAAMLRAESAWRAALKNETIASLVVAVAATADPRSVRKAGPWLQRNVRLPSTK